AAAPLAARAGRSEAASGALRPRRSVTLAGCRTGHGGGARGRGGWVAARGKCFITVLCFFPALGVFFSVTSLLPSILQQPARTLTYCSLRNGKRKSVKSVVKRFLRLHNGLWVRRKSGYKKKLWKKSASQRKRLRELVLCTRTQCKLLDKMTTSFWKRRNWYVDDPYQKYHDRTNLHM
uniref:Large ribosomal subunit protein bL35m n=1 Tax=Falco tinnunculus TaxID=100819 RepID=A0A8C4V4W7_FALTI